ncbi:hypothetical protein [Marinicella sp. W31]|uniref:hypothetical protein n=1 Tax=Marinicella sp. W31 TaxID=3023713 RepID=UPI003756AA74
MSLLKDAVQAMKDVVLLSDKVDRTGKNVEKIANKLEDIDRRLIRIETMAELARSNPVNANQLDKK